MAHLLLRLLPLAAVLAAAHKASSKIQSRSANSAYPFEPTELPVEPEKDAGESRKPDRTARHGREKRARFMTDSDQSAAAPAEEAPATRMEVESASMERAPRRQKHVVEEEEPEVSLIQDEHSRHSRISEEEQPEESFIEEKPRHRRHLREDEERYDEETRHPRQLPEEDDVPKRHRLMREEERYHSLPLEEEEESRHRRHRRDEEPSNSLAEEEEEDEPRYHRHAVQEGSHEEEQEPWQQRQRQDDQDEDPHHTKRRFDVNDAHALIEDMRHQEMHHHTGGTVTARTDGKAKHTLTTLSDTVLMLLADPMFRMVFWLVAIVFAVLMCCPTLGEILAK